MRRFFGTALGCVGLFVLFLRKTEFYVLCVKFLFGSSAFLCVSLNHAVRFSCGLFKFTHMVIFIFSFVFGLLVVMVGK